ncbi:MAG: type III-A CRISPR-associated RAMP protein Csm3 [Sulfobacillus thermosulfidooxidans]|uniref:CRISPR system Cms endoribonuclease Csm3 n=1 Tax=Sulfobacillus thermosulfidooxidans TaxID=28034 RepID=A0A2T2WT62_SULTH|nr:MAG: type III-A CRISPR-associated RAMP protein Csm3 [Sulfobacillus thermosulfidooxidans]
MAGDDNRRGESSPNPHLREIWEVTAELTCVTGCHVGGSKDILEIGGIDNPIIRHPLTQQPYLPGSSLKGKFRSLLEAVDGKGVNGEPCGCALPTCRVCRYFGPHRKPRHTLNPTRFLFRDAFLTRASQEALETAYEHMGLFYAEEKFENTINRKTHVATNPRVQERVPAGTTFNFVLGVRIYHGDDMADIKATIEEMVALVEHDALGGSGSRGSGQIRLEQLTFRVVWPDAPR